MLREPAKRALTPKGGREQPEEPKTQPTQTRRRGVAGSQNAESGGSEYSAV